LIALDPDGGQPKIADATEYQKVREELRALEQRLARLQESHPADGAKGFI